MLHVTIYMHLYKLTDLLLLQYLSVKAGSQRIVIITYGFFTLLFIYNTKHLLETSCYHVVITVHSEIVYNHWTVIDNIFVQLRHFCVQH